MTVTGLLDDLRWALRSLARTRGFALLGGLLLALGISVNLAIFSLVEATLLRPLPYGHPSRLVALWEQAPSRGKLREYFSATDYYEWERASTRLKGLCALSTGAANLSGGFEPERVRVGRVSWNFLDVLEVRPVLGRGFEPAEDAPGAARAVLLTWEFWKRHGGDPALLGRSLRLDGVDSLVVGILPPGFDFQHRTARSDVYMPLAMSAAERTSRDRHWLTAVARLKDGATAREAEDELKALCARLAAESPDTNHGYTARVAPLQDELVKDARPTLWALLGAVGFVLLIAAANLANLLLARGARRTQELAVRAALGAGRLRILRLLLAESLLLGLLGGALGLAASRIVVPPLAALVGLPSPGGGAWPLVAATLALSLAAALLAGLPPALRLSRVGAGSLRDGTRTAGTRAHHRLNALLVAAETALATALLVGAGLLMRTFLHLQGLHPGFDPKVIAVQVALPGGKYRGNAAQGEFARRAQERFQAVPGVASAALMDNLPLSGSMRQAGVGLEPGFSDPSDLAFCYRATPGYFRTLGIPLLLGRDFEPGDRSAAIVSEAFARSAWPGRDPIGRRIFLDAEDARGMTVLGVVGDVRHESMALPPRAGFYVPLLDPEPAYLTAPGLVLVLRAQAPPSTLLPSLRQALRELDPDLPLGQVRTLEDLMDQSRRDARARGLLFGAFSLLALVLAGAGVFGVVSYLAGLRTREMGIRSALGARGRDLAGLVLGQGMAMLGAGGAAGLLLALGLARLLRAELLGVGPLDPAAYLLALGLVALCGAAASLLPALRAARVEPAEALRSE